MGYVLFGCKIEVYPNTVFPTILLEGSYSHYTSEEKMEVNVSEIMLRIKQLANAILTIISELSFAVK